MGQYGKVLLAIDNAHTVPHMAVDYGPGLCYSTIRPILHQCWRWLAGIIPFLKHSARFEKFIYLWVNMCFQLKV